MTVLYQNMIQAFIDKRQWFIDDDLPWPKYIDFYMGQTEHPEEWEFVPNAVLMDYSTPWELKGKIYVGEPQVIFHCVPPDEFPSASNISSRIEAGLKTTLWYKTVAQVLDTVTTDHSTSLRRVHEDTTVSAVGPYHKMIYKTAIDALPGTERDKYVDGKIDDIGINGRIVKQFTL